MIEIPGGLYDSTRRPKHLRVVSYGDWYLAAAGLLARVGFGELALADLRAVAAELGERVFVAHPKPHSLQDHLPPGSWVARRMRVREERTVPLEPSAGAVARGAQVAVVPELGVVWVDGEHLFRPGEVVPLPWTEPLVELTVVRPRTVLDAMRRVIGKGGPDRVQPSDRD